jgi:hypothetical protein
VAWRIDFTRNADKAMRKLDKGVAARVFDELDEIAKLEDPRSRGKALTGNLAGVWRYRVGDYRPCATSMTAGSSFSWSMLRIDARFTSADKKRKAPASLAAAGAFETRRL